MCDAKCLMHPPCCYSLPDLVGDKPERRVQHSFRFHAVFLPTSDFVKPPAAWSCVAVRLSAFLIGFVVSKLGVEMAVMPRETGREAFFRLLAGNP